MKEDKLIIIRNSETFGFSAQGGVSRPSAWLPFRVCHHVCPARLGLPPSHPSLRFDRDTGVQSFEITFLMQNWQNEKQVEKRPDIHL